MAISYPQTPKYGVQFEWISESWRLFQAYTAVWIPAVLIYLVIIIWAYAALFYSTGLWAALDRMGPGRLVDPYALYRMPSYWVVALVMNLIAGVLMAGFVRMANTQVRGQAISAGMLFRPGPITAPFVLYLFVVSITAYIGLFLCVLPGLALYALYLPGLALVADGVPFGEAWSRSFAVMKRDWLTAIGLMLAYYLLFTFGSVLTCGLGMFALFPMGFIILSLVYRDMIDMPDVPARPDPLFANTPPVSGVWPPPPTSSPPPPESPVPPSPPPTL